MTKQPIGSCVTFKFTNFGEKDKERSGECLVNTDPGVIGCIHFSAEDRC